MVIGITLPLVSRTQVCEFSYRKYTSGNYAILYNILSNYAWSCVYGASSVNSAVTSLSVAVQDAMDQAVPCGYVAKSKFPQWFSSSLKYYIRKKNYFYRRFKKHKYASLYDNFSFYRKLIKTTIKADRLRWLESLNANIRTQPRHFWKCVVSFREKSSTSIQLVVDGSHLVDHCEVASAFPYHFQLAYNDPSPQSFPTLSSTFSGSLFLSQTFLKPLNV
jgi:hypothetical protein